MVADRPTWAASLRQERSRPPSRANNCQLILAAQTLLRSLEQFVITLSQANACIFLIVILTFRWSSNRSRAAPLHRRDETARRAPWLVRGNERRCHHRSSGPGGLAGGERVLGRDRDRAATVRI